MTGVVTPDPTEDAPESRANAQPHGRTVMLGDGGALFEGPTWDAHARQDRE